LGLRVGKERKELVPNRKAQRNPREFNALKIAATLALDDFRALHYCERERRKTKKKEARRRNRKKKEKEERERKRKRGKKKKIEDGNDPKKKKTNKTRDSGSHRRRLTKTDIKTRLTNITDVAHELSGICRTT